MHYSLENFHGALGHGHHVLYISSDSRGKLLQSAGKSRKFSYSKVLPYTVSEGNTVEISTTFVYLCALFLIKKTSFVT